MEIVIHLIRYKLITITIRTVVMVLIKDQNQSGLVKWICHHVSLFFFKIIFFSWVNKKLFSAYKIGEVPKYLQERKELIMKAEKEREEFDPDCPDGHVVLSDRDRVDSLGIARTSKFVFYIKKNFFK